MILNRKCKKVSQTILIRATHLENTPFLFSIAPARYEYLHRNFGQLHSRALKHPRGYAKSLNCSLPSRSCHGSTFIEEKHLDTPSRVWKSYLKTFEQCEYQSDFGQQSSKGPRLLDQPPFSTDFELWLELVLFRRRLQDVNSLKALYDKIIVTELQLPTAGATADGLWNNFLYLGWATDTVWKDVVPYARRLQVRMGCSWQPLYVKILLHSLKSAPQDAALWHARLRANFKPSSADMKDIFSKAFLSESTLEVFKRIYLDFSVRDMYSTIIPQLCNEGNYKLALQWHHMMITMDDKPSSSKIAAPLSHHLALQGKTEELISMTTSMAQAGVPSVVSANPSLASKRTTISELFNRQLGAIHNISPKSLSDEFCARLFATPAFPIGTLIEAIHMLGVDKIGPISLREFLLREFVSRKKESSSRPISQCLDPLREAGISTGDSTFCTVISNLAFQGNERLLEEVINCDMHPDAFEDRNLQESLLDKYIALGDYLQTSRTLAILTAKCKPESLQSTLMNLILRSAVKRKDNVEIHKQLDLMKEKRVPVGAISARTFRNMLSPRAFSKPPTSVAELPDIIAIFQGILRTGGDLRPHQWTEILRRLGMSGSLIDLEKIVLWLAEWYSNPSFRSSESSFFNQKCDYIPEKLPIGNPRYPLRILFPPVAQQAIVAWGLQHTGELHRNPTAIKNTGVTWRWGIELLQKLRGRDVLILRNTVSRACRLRLIALFGDRMSRRLISRPAHKLTVDQFMQLAQEMEKIWGSDVFNHRTYWFPPGDPMRLAVLKQQIMGDRTNNKPSNRWKKGDGFVEMFGSPKTPSGGIRR